MNQCPYRANVFYEAPSPELPAQLFFPIRPVVGDFLSFQLSTPPENQRTVPGAVLIRTVRYFVAEVVLFCRTAEGPGPGGDDAIMAVRLAEAPWRDLP